MKNSYKILTITIAFILCMPCINALASPSTIDAVTHQKYNEIIDANVLIERAKSNVNEAPQNMVKQILESSTVSVDGYSLNKSNVMVTSQLLEKSTLSNGDRTSIYATTIVADIIPNDIKAPIANNTMAIRASHTKQEGDYSVATILTTIYYTSGSTGNINWWTIDKVVGSFSPKDSSKVSERRVRGGYSGWNHSTQKAEKITAGWLTGTTATITRTINSPKLEANAGYPLYIWGESNCKVTRNTQSWNITVKCEQSSK